MSDHDPQLCDVEGCIECAPGPEPLDEQAIRTDERRKVIAELEEGLAELELHDDLPDSYDLGYMACWRDVRNAIASPLAPVEEGDGRNGSARG